MGNTSSILIPENGRIYKPLECGCICALLYKEYCVTNIELLCPCYTCLEEIREKRYSTSKISKLFEDSVDKNISLLTNDNYPDKWMLEYVAVEYAKKRKIPYEEFILKDGYIITNYNKNEMIKTQYIKL